MSLIPLLMELNRPSRIQDQHFALALTPEDMLTIVVPQSNREYYRPWHQLSNALKDVGSTIRNDKRKFQINLDVQHFSPEEISVKTANGFLVIEGQHGEKRDEHGWVSRKFRRRYELPEGCNLEAVESRLSSDGVLSVTAPLECAKADERIVPIIQTGPLRTQLGGQKANIGDGEPVEKDPIENGQ
ncbi:protein lethal(2)essential for life-like [Plodia interpunctella]|uniref:protein lethal(2)essential for life-like n=1 Tax=Plodia interpunctella TaxID=58824 RepID=UPI002368BC36|nr:protein lethal(2)essential for life-like [Plodia interpunctella]